MSFKVYSVKTVGIFVLEKMATWIIVGSDSRPHIVFPSHAIILMNVSLYSKTFNMSKNNNYFMVRAEIRKQLKEGFQLSLDYFNVFEITDFVMNAYYTYNSKRAYAVDSSTGNSLILSPHKLSVILGKKASWMQIIPPMIDYANLSADIETILALIDTVILQIDDD